MITIPIWVLATILFLAGIVWASKTNGDWDFSPIIKLPLVLCGYLFYWVIQLAWWNLS